MGQHGNMPEICAATSVNIFKCISLALVQFKFFVFSRCCQWKFIFTNCILDRSPNARYEESSTKRK